jgi:hypothetical protein
MNDGVLGIGYFQFALNLSRTVFERDLANGWGELLLVLVTTFCRVA